MTSFRFDHVHLFTRDIDATARWYRDILGAEILESVQSDGATRVDVRLGALRLYLADGPRVEAAVGERLVPAPEGMHYGLDHFGLLVDDLEAAVAELRERGVHVSFGPRALRPGVRIAYIEGPDGVAIEIASRDPHLDARPVTHSRFTLEESAP